MNLERKQNRVPCDAQYSKANLSRILNMQRNCLQETSPSASLLGRNMSKYFLYGEISQKCPWKQFGRSPWEKTSSPLYGKRGTGGEGRKERGRWKEREKKSCCEQRRDGEHGKGKRVGVSAVRNADPFPRWPLSTISLPTAGPKNHNVAVCLLPALLSARPAAEEFPWTAFIWFHLKHKYLISTPFVKVNLQQLLKLYLRWCAKCKVDIVYVSELLPYPGCSVCICCHILKGCSGPRHVWNGPFTRAGIVWHGSFMEDGCYLLGPSWSLGQKGEHRSRESWRK